MSHADGLMGTELGDWLYPHAQHGAGGQADDMKFIHAQYTEGWTQWP